MFCVNKHHIADFEKPGHATSNTNAILACKHLIQVSEDSLLVENMVTEMMRN